jgi:hypothetical protein
MGRADGPADETENRPSDEHSASDRSVAVDATERTHGRSQAEANRGPDQGVTRVARTRQRILITPPVISLARHHRRSAAGQLSQRFASVGIR